MGLASRGVIATSDLQSFNSMSIFDKLTFGKIYSVDEVKGTMIVALQTSRSTGKVTPPIRINWNFGYAVDSRFNVPFAYGVRTMPVRGMTVLLYRTKTSYIHLGSILSGIENITLDLRKPVDELKNAVALYLREGETGLESNGDFIKLKRGDGIEIRSSPDLGIEIIRSLNQQFYEATQYLRKTQAEKSEEAFGQILRMTAAEPINVLQYDSAAVNAMVHEEYHRVIQKAMTAGVIDPLTPPEYEESISPKIIMQAASEPFSLPQKSSILGTFSHMAPLAPTPQDLIYFRKFYHQSGLIGQSGIKGVDIVEEIGDDGEYGKSLTYNQSTNVSLNIKPDSTTVFRTNNATIKVDSVGTITIENPIVSITIGSEGAVELKNATGSVEIAADGTITAKNSTATIEAKSTGDINLSNPATSLKISPAGTIDIGTGASQPLVLGTSFQTLYMSHTHPTAMGPSGPPVVPMVPGAHLSLVNKTK